MKHMKNWLGIMMSIILAASSLQVPVYAANADETVTGTETGSAGAEAADPLADEDIDEENRSDAAGQEEMAGTDDSANKDADSEDADSADDGKDQPADSEGAFSDVSEDQDSYEEEASGEYEDANKPAASDDGTSETEKESVPVNELTQEQIDEYQKSLKIWKNENKVFLVCDSGEDLQFSLLSCSIYNDRSGDLLFSGNLHRDEQSGLYYDAACTRLAKQFPATDANGASQVIVPVTQATMYIKEIKAPEGFYINDEVRHISKQEMTESADRELVVTDDYKRDPAQITIEKRAAGGVKGNSLENAEARVHELCS